MEGKRERKQVIVGHVPLRLSRIFHLFLKLGGQISVQVTGKRRNKGIGLEISATYTFCHKKDKNTKCDFRFCYSRIFATGGA